MIAGTQRTAFRFLSTKLLVANFTIALVSGLLILQPGALAGEQTSPAGELRVFVEDGRFNLEGEGVPLRVLLEALRDHAGFKLDLRGDEETLVSPSIVDLPLQQALAQILGDERISYVLAFKPGQAGDAGRKVSKLTVFSRQGGQRRAADPATAGRSPAERPLEPIEPNDRQSELEAIEILEQFLLEAEDSDIREATLEALRDIEAVAADL